MMEQRETEDAWYSELLTTPVDTPVKSEDDATNKRTGTSPDGGGAVSPGLCWRESYCLLVQVACNVDSVSALDAKVPFFLLFQGPWSGPWMTWENTIPYIWILHDIHDWGSTEVTVVAGQCTMKQAKIDLANTRE